MNKILLLILSFCFFVECSDTQPTESGPGGNEPPIVNEFIFSGTAHSNYSDSTISNLIVILEGDSIFIDTTDAIGHFSFTLNTEGEYKFFIEDTLYQPFDSLIEISKDTSIEIYLSPYLYDYFPLSIGNRWKYTYGLRDICGGDNVYVNGVEDWEITDMEESENGTVTYTCQRNFEGIKIDARGPYDPVTSEVKISDEFTIVEDHNNIVLIMHPGFNPALSLQRYYTKDYPEEIIIDSTIELEYRYKKNIGLTFRETFTGSGHCNTTITRTLNTFHIEK